MRVPLSWLREYVDLADDAATVAEALSMSGVGVEAIEGDVLVLEITSNRADLLSILGVARELAVLRGARLKPPAVTLADDGPAPETRVEVADRALCPRYTARIVRGVRVAPAPMWMQQKLRAALGDGYAPINNVADITNYVQLECGQPLHAFDLGLLRGNRIEVRPAKPDEKMTAINGKEYVLRKGDLVIADGERTVAIAGVMGGKESEIAERTTDVLIESAMFDPVSVRRTSRRLGLSSESSYRFERGVDWDTVDWASQRCAQLIAEIAGGRVAKGVVDVAAPRPPRPPVAVRYDRVRKILGLDVPSERIRQILEGLGAQIVRNSASLVEVRPPAGRRDLNAEIDFVEEVARIEGYERIPTDVQLGLSPAHDHPADLVRGEIRSALTALGAFEVLTWSFEEATAAPTATFWSKEKLLPLRNPRGNVDRTLRSALAPALLGIFRTNEGCGEELHPIFEIAHVYFGVPDGDKPGEKAVVGLAHPGGVAEARGMVRVLFERLQIPLATARLDEPWIQSGESILLEGRAVGYLGKLERIGVAEIDFDRLAEAARLTRKLAPYSVHPSVRRDIALVFPDRVTWPEIEGVVRGLELPILREASYLNHFEGKQLGEGKRSVAASLTFLAPDRTLAGPEVEAAVEAVVSALASRLGGVRR